MSPHIARYVVIWPLAAALATTAIFFHTLDNEFVGTYGLLAILGYT